MRDENFKIELESETKDAEEIVALIDQMMSQGVGRLKIKPSEELEPGELLKEYHHGRCDIGSPWAQGCAFDVLE